MHGSGERPTFDDKKRVACGGFPRNGDKDYGFPEPFCLGRQSEGQPQPLPAVTQEVFRRPRCKKERSV